MKGGLVLNFEMLQIVNIDGPTLIKFLKRLTFTEINKNQNYKNIPIGATVNYDIVFTPISQQLLNLNK